MRAMIRYGIAALALGAAWSEASAATLTFDGVQFPGTGMPLIVTGSDGTTFTFSAGDTSQFESFASGGTSFPVGTYFLLPGLGVTDPVNAVFSAPLSMLSFGVASDRVGDSPYTTTVTFSNSGLLLSSTTTGNTLNPAATFSSTGALTSVNISTQVNPANAPFGYSQNIGPFTYERVAAVPSPIAGAGLLPLVALAGALFVRRRSAAAA